MSKDKKKGFFGHIFDVFKYGAALIVVVSLMKARNSSEDNKSITSVSNIVETKKERTPQSNPSTKVKVKKKHIKHYAIDEKAVIREVEKLGLVCIKIDLIKKQYRRVCSDNYSNSLVWETGEKSNIADVFISFQTKHPKFPRRPEVSLKLTYLFGKKAGNQVAKLLNMRSPRTLPPPLFSKIPIGKIDPPDNYNTMGISSLAHLASYGNK